MSEERKLRKLNEFIEAIKVRNADPERAPVKQESYKLNGVCDETCPLCHGLGFVGKSDNPYGLELCPNYTRLIWFHEIGISEGEAAILDWSAFATRSSSTKIKRALSLLHSRGYGLLYLWGNPGVGKSALSKSATIIASRRYHYRAHYTTQANMIDQLRASYDEDGGQKIYKQRMDALMKYNWLVIDEIGRDRNSDFSKAVMSEILNSRYTMCIEGKSGVTVLISNFDPKEVLDDYQLDRVNDKRSTVLHIQDVSFRALPLWDDENKKQGDPLWWQKL